MKVFYNEGPLRMGFGEAGEFRLGVPKDVPDYLANILLRKGLVKKVDVPLAPEEEWAPIVTAKSRKKGE